MVQFWDARWCAIDRTMVLTVQKTMVILQLQFIEKVVDIWVCRSCSSSVLSWRSRAPTIAVVELWTRLTCPSLCNDRVLHYGGASDTVHRLFMWTFQLNDFPAFLLMAAMMDFLTHFASFFAVLRLCRSLSASFSSFRALTTVSARGLQGVLESPGV